MNTTTHSLRYDTKHITSTETHCASNPSFIRRSQRERKKRDMILHNQPAREKRVEERGKKIRIKRLFSFRIDDTPSEERNPLCETMHAKFPRTGHYEASDGSVQKRMMTSMIWHWQKKRKKAWTWKKNVDKDTAKEVEVVTDESSQLFTWKREKLNNEGKV